MHSKYMDVDLTKDFLRSGKKISTKNMKAMRGNEGSILTRYQGFRPQ